jgi:hypothetical protein
MEPRRVTSCLCLSISMVVRHIVLRAMANPWLSQPKTDLPPGSFLSGNKDGTLAQPGGMILQAIENGEQRVLALESVQNSMLLLLTIYRTSDNECRAQLSAWKLVNL